MADLIYNRGLDELATWTSATYKFMLLKGSGYTPNKDHDFVTNLTPASNEVAGAGYTRQTVGTPTRTIDDTNDRITYDCADPAFGSIASGETVSAMVLYRQVSSDTDHILIAYFDITDTPTSGSAFSIVVDAQGLLYVDQGP